MLHFLLFIFILFYYRRNVIGHAQKFSCVSTSVPHTEWNSFEQCYNVLHHDRSPAFLNSCWFLICEHIIKSQKSFGNRVKNIFLFQFFRWIIVNFDEKMQKTEKTGENTGESPAGSYLLDPMIMAYMEFKLTLVLLIWPILGVFSGSGTIYGNEI